MYTKKDIDGRVQKKLEAQKRVAEELKFFEQRDDLMMHHEAVVAGYVPRQKLRVTGYNGRYGVGYRVDIPQWEGSKFYRRRYYIYKSDKN